MPIAFEMLLQHHGPLGTTLQVKNMYGTQVRGASPEEGSN